MSDKALIDLIELSLEYLNLVSLVLVGLFLLAVLLEEAGNELIELVLLVVVFVLEGEEVLVKRDAVSQEGLITASLVLLVYLSVLQEFYLRLHQHNLLLQVQDVLFFEILSNLVFSLLLSLLLLLLVTALEVGISLKFLVTRRTGLVSIARSPVSLVSSSRFLAHRSI